MGSRLFHHILRFFREQRGVTAPITAISLVVLLGFTSLALDGGLLYRDRRDVQNMADAAALAGAHELPGSPAQALSVAQQYVLNNGGSLDDIEEIAVTATFNPTDSVEVRLRHSVPLFFAPVIGHTEQDVSARSVGLVAPIEPYDIWPWGVPQEYIVYDENVTLKVGAQSSMTGNFMALQFIYPSHRAAQEYEEFIKYGYQGDLPGPIPPNVWDIHTLNGVIAGNTRDGVRYLLTQPACNPLWTDVRCPRIGLLPVLDAGTWNEVTGKSEVRAVSFAVFELTGMGSNPGLAEVRGIFRRYAYGVGRRFWVGNPLEGLLGVRLWQ